MSNDFNWLHDAWTTKRKLHGQVIVTDRFDRQDLSRMLEEVAQFDRARNQLGDFTPTGLDASSDAFFEFLKGLPLRRDIHDMEPENFINHRVNEEMRQLPETERLRRFTVGDDVQAALAMEQIEPDLETLFDRTRKEQEHIDNIRDLLNKLIAAQQQAEDLDDMVERWKAEHPPEEPEEGEEDAEEGADGQGEGEGETGEGEEQEGAEEPGVPEELLEDQAQAHKDVSDLEQQLQDALDQLEADLEHVGSEARQLLRSALTKAGDQAQQIHDAANAWGLDQGRITRLPADERIAIAKKLNTPYFRKLADLFGPMKNLMFTEQIRKVSYAREEVFDVGMGSDLGRLLPSELLNLDQNEDDFLRRFSEGKLLQYEMRGNERKARGGIIVCEDGSSSMAGEKELWAKGVMLCLLHLARQQNRPFHLIHFGGPGQYKVISFETPSSYEFTAIVEAAELFFNSGTNFQTPMTVALDLLVHQHSKFGEVKSDVVFVTDDECHVNNDFMEKYLKESARLQFTTYGMAITPRIPSEHGALAQMSEGKVFHIRDLLSGEEIREVFRKI